MNTQKSPQKEWDVIMFFVDPTGANRIETFMLVPVDETTTHPLSPISDRVECRVGLVSLHKGITTIQDPFVSNFIDPFVYAERMLKCQFTGIMVKTGNDFLDTFFTLSYDIIAYNIAHSGKDVMDHMFQDYNKQK